MATFAFFHAHPDDEAIATGGTMARARAEGHEVVLVVATGGELGERPPGVDSAEALRELRARETEEASRILGVTHGHFLGYTDSGMAGDEANAAPGCFAAADVEEAAHRLAGLLAPYRPDVLVVYDDNGGYGHPDHIQVHRVGVRAAEIAGIDRVYETTMEREHMVEVFRAMVEAGVTEFEPDEAPAEEQFGKPSAQITTRVDVSEFLEQKRAAMAAHRSQIAETSFFLALSPELFHRAWSTEWYIRRGAPPGTAEDWLLDGE